MSVRVLYFAGIRDALGCDAETWPLEKACSAHELRAALAARPGYGALMTHRNLRCAVNQAMSAWDAQVQPGDEVAFFPPVTGG